MSKLKVYVYVEDHQVGDYVKCCNCETKQLVNYDENECKECKTDGVLMDIRQDCIMADILEMEKDVDFILRR